MIPAAAKTKKTNKQSSCNWWWRQLRIRFGGNRGVASVIICTFTLLAIASVSLLGRYPGTGKKGKWKSPPNDNDESKHTADEDHNIYYSAWDGTFPGFTPKWNSRVQFVFVMGLEGTGHHFVNTVVFGSPAKKKWEEMGLEPNKLNSKVGMHPATKGIFDMHCGMKGDVNPEKTMKELVDLIWSANSNATSSPYNSNQSIVRLPFYIMASYPTLFGKCRKLRYPNVGMLYEACDEAKVDCGHIYLYRDPSEVLRSTIEKRKFNKEGVLAAIHLYTSMLKIIIAELHIHSERTIGCFNFFEHNVTTWWDAMRILWDWGDTKEYEMFMSENYRAPTKISNPENNEMKNVSLKPYMDSFQQMHEYAETLCKQNIKSLP